MLAALLCGIRALAPTPCRTPALVRVPAMTFVMLRMSERVNSDRTGSRLSIPVYGGRDVRVGGSVVIPAGAQGEGEVIHAAESGGRDHPGELVLAARFVRVGTLEVRLRSFVAGATDRAQDALAVPIFDRSSGGGRGDSVNLGRGGVASARIAEEVQLPALVFDESDAPAAASVESADAAPAIDASGTTGTMVFFRENAPGRRREAFKIREAAAVLGELDNGAWFEVQVPVGIHHVSSRGAAFHDLSLEIDSGETYYVACNSPRSGAAGWQNCAPSNRSLFEYMKADLRKAVDRK